MSDDTFENYARARVANLRSEAAKLTNEADVLENALRSFRPNGGATVHVVHIDTSVMARTWGDAARASRTQPDSQAGRILATLDAAREKGCTIHDIYRSLADHGVTNTNSIRSGVWHLKTNRKIEAHEDRYYAKGHGPRDENRPEGSNPPSLLPTG